MKNKKGLIIVVEGTDSSGKATQTNLIYKRLLSEGIQIKKVSFPRYDNASSTLVKMYLNGDFGKTAESVSPYIASTFYAADRYASYKQDWEEFYLNGGIIIMDRYTQSNMIHQGGKFIDQVEREKFLNWLMDLEYNIYGIPIPDLIFFMDVPLSYSLDLMKDRNNKITNEEAKDIHEKDIKHLADSYKCATTLINKYGWKWINCINRNKLRDIQDINDEIYSIIKRKIKECE